MDEKSHIYEIIKEKMIDRTFMVLDPKNTYRYICVIRQEDINEILDEVILRGI